MLFHSPAFFVFFAAYFAAHVIIPTRFRLWLIIVGGAIFYAQWNIALTWLPFLLAFIGWAGAIWISAAPESPGRKIRLAVTIVALASPLLIFKYTNFILHQVIEPTVGLPEGWVGWSLEWPLPLGVSFVTFTMMAYVIDYYRGKYKLEWRPQMIAAYMVFFPHLIAGPILRPREIIPQLDHPRPALDASFKFPLILFTIGLAKKAIFANQFAEAVDRVYALAGSVTAWDYVLAIYGFSAQIYCDFSGYTDMAIALALMIGVRLPNNFNRPYTAFSVADFWRRWHITLSFWLRDYVYISLGGNRAGWVRRFSNVMITMVVGGLWHGANWTFVIWGACHGLFIAVSQLLPTRVKKAGALRTVSILVTFHIVTILWVLFRAPDLATVGRMLTGPFVSPAGDAASFVAANAYTLLLLAVFFVWHPVDSHGRLRFLGQRLSAPILWPAVAMVWALAVSLSAGSSAKFIYFDF
jgi:alginate O-acetyltransferase complex protein AlgI